MKTKVTVYRKRSRLDETIRPTVISDAEETADRVYASYVDGIALAESMPYPVDSIDHDDNDDIDARTIDVLSALDYTEWTQSELIRYTKALKSELQAARLNLSAMSTAILRLSVSPASKPDKPASKPVSNPASKPDKPVSKPAGKPDKPVSKPDKPVIVDVDTKESIDRILYKLLAVRPSPYKGLHIAKPVWSIAFYAKNGHEISNKQYALVVKLLSPELMRRILSD
jgi:hypothetical protein